MRRSSEFQLYAGFAIFLVISLLLSIRDEETIRKALAENDDLIAINNQLISDNRLLTRCIPHGDEVVIIYRKAGNISCETHEERKRNVKKTSNT